MRVLGEPSGGRARTSGLRSVVRVWLSILAVSLLSAPLVADRALAGGLDRDSEVAGGAPAAGSDPMPAPSEATVASAPTPVEHSIEIPVEGESEVPGAPAVGIAPASPDAAAEEESRARAQQRAAAADEALELELDDRPTSFPDPFEGINRRTLSLNQTVDRWVLDPVTDAYVYVVPDRAQRSVRDFFANLESPAIFVNDVLQGELAHAATTFARFSVNTLIGLAGFFDPATDMGLERHDADFGQTLARTGFGSGPFLIVPLLGPTTVRDGIGTLVDVAMQPTIYLLGPTPLVVASVQEGTDGLTLRAQHGEDLKRLEQGSLDYYAALRSAYYQDRMATLGELAASEDASASAEPASDGRPSPAQALASTPKPDDPT